MLKWIKEAQEDGQRSRYIYSRPLSSFEVVAGGIQPRRPRRGLEHFTSRGAALYEILRPAWTSTYFGLSRLKSKQRLRYALLQTLQSLHSQTSCAKS